MNGTRNLVVGALCATALITLPALSSGAVLTVRQDGSGDYVTISAAVNAASANDTIDVGEGVYYETVMVQKSLTLLAPSGADLTVMDGEGSNRLMMIEGSCVVEVRGFGFANAYGSGNGGAVRVSGGGSAAMRECAFSGNTATFDGGGFYARDAGSVLTLDECSFAGNSAGHNGGAGNAVLGATLHVTGCTFVGNSVGTYGAGVSCDNGTMNVSESVFHANASGDVSGGLYYFRSAGLARNNTFHENAAPGSYGGSVVVQESDGVAVNRSIFSGTAAGHGLVVIYCYPSHSCNVFWQNESGPILGGELSPDEIQADPLFCGPASDDFTISIHSPAAPSNSPCGQLVGALAPACDIEPFPEKPVIESIADVGNDQGRKVRIVWQRSQRDAAGYENQVLGYALYRRQDAFLAAEASSPADGVPRARSELLSGWDYVMTVPARGDAVYQAIAPTLCDSTVEHGICWSVFFVSAMTADPLVYFDSAPDSGYSLDNLAPCAPSDFSVAYNAGAGNRLAWARPKDDDVRCVRVYRGAFPEFTPGPESLVHATVGNEWLDEAAEGYLYHYKITAVDYSGNESDPASPSEVTGAPAGSAPKEPALYANAPNPFNPSTVIRYDVPSPGGMVRIVVYDVSGRAVRTLVNGEAAPGEKRVAWNGRDENGEGVSSGVYFCRMTLGSFAQTRKMVLTR